MVEQMWHFLTTSWRARHLRELVSPVANDFGSRSPAQRSSGGGVGGTSLCRVLHNTDLPNSEVHDLPILTVRNEHNK